MRKLVYYALLLIFLSMTCVAGQDRFPDITGAWKANLDKSEIPGPPPDEMKYSIRFEGDMLLMTATETLAGAPPRIVELKFDKTGKETVNRFGDTEMRTVLRVEGKEVLEETVFTTGAVKVYRKSRQFLSDDGKTLTLTGDYSGDRGEYKIKIVLDKQ